MVIFHSYINVYQRVNYNDLTATEPWDDGIFLGGTSPKIAEPFRLVTES